VSKRKRCIVRAVKELFTAWIIRVEPSKRRGDPRVAHARLAEN
jgi:hypothetical protein